MLRNFGDTTSIEQRETFAECSSWSTEQKPIVGIMQNQTCENGVRMRLHWILETSLVTVIHACLVIAHSCQCYWFSVFVLFASSHPTESPHQMGKELRCLAVSIVPIPEDLMAAWTLCPQYTYTKNIKKCYLSITILWSVCQLKWTFIGIETLRITSSIIASRETRIPSGNPSQRNQSQKLATIHPYGHTKQQHHWWNRSLQDAVGLKSTDRRIKKWASSRQQLRTFYFRSKKMVGT